MGTNCGEQVEIVRARLRGVLRRRQIIVSEVQALFPRPTLPLEIFLTLESLISGRITQLAVVAGEPRIRCPSHRRFPPVIRTAGGHRAPTCRVKSFSPSSRRLAARSSRLP